MSLRRKIKKSRLEILTGLVILGATALTIGITEGYQLLERKNVFQGTKNVISDVNYWLEECYKTGYIKDIKRRTNK